MKTALRPYLPVILIACIFTLVAFALRKLTGSTFYLINFLIIGASIASGMGLWPLLPSEKKPVARRVSQILVGGYMFFGLGVGLIYVAFGTPFSLIKIKPNRRLCVECGKCERTCPMDVRITAYVKEGRRVSSSECIICQSCVSACPKGALRPSLGFDVDLHNFLNFRRIYSHTSKTCFADQCGHI